MDICYALKCNWQLRKHVIKMKKGREQMVGSSMKQISFPRVCLFLGKL